MNLDYFLVKVMIFEASQEVRIWNSDLFQLIIFMYFSFFLIILF